MGTKNQRAPQAPVRAWARHTDEHLGAVEIDDEAATLDAQLGERAVRLVFEADGGVWLTLRRRTPAGWVGVSLDLDDVFVAHPLPASSADDDMDSFPSALVLPRAA